MSRNGWIGSYLRELRNAAGLSLKQFEAKHGIPAVVLGSYERGDRQITVAKADEILRMYGKRLMAVDLVSDEGFLPVRTSEEIADNLVHMALALRAQGRSRGN